MVTRDDLSEIVECLQERLWGRPPSPLGEWDAPLRERLAASGLTARVVLDELSDESLVLAFRAGFEAADAFTILMVERCGPLMLRLLGRWGTESHQALDVIQQVYVNFYERGLASYRPEENFRAYLRRSVYHLWVEKVCRARKSRPLENGGEVPSPHPDPVQSLIDRELAERIDAAIPLLLPLERTVLTRTLADESADAIADSLGLPKERIFMALFRGRRRLERLVGLPQKKRAPRNSSPRPTDHPKEPSRV